MRKQRVVDIDSAKIMKNVLDALRYKAPSFAKELELTPNAIYNITKGENVISDDLIDKIVKKFPNVHYWYLKKGTLPIIVTNSISQAQANIFSSKEKSPDFGKESFLALKDMAETMNEQLEVLKEIRDLLQTQKKADQ